MGRLSEVVGSEFDNLFRKSLLPHNQQIWRQAQNAVFCSAIKVEHPSGLLVERRLPFTSSWRHKHREREREIQYVHSASLADEDGAVFMFEPFAARQ